MRLGAIRALAALCCLPLLTIAIPAHAAPSATMWQIVRSPAWDLNVRSIERRSDPLPAIAGQAPVRPAGRFALFVVDLRNRTDRPLAPQSGDFVLWPAAEAPSLNLGELPAARAYAAAAGLTPFGDPIAPGATVTTVVVFDIDAHAGRLTLRFLPANRTIRIDECHCNLPSPVRTVTNGGL
jgi:hypothetical protein